MVTQSVSVSAPWPSFRKDIHMKVRTRTRPRNRNAPADRRARFERAVASGQFHLTEAIKSLVRGDPQEALFTAHCDGYGMAALLAKELTELSGKYVPVVPRKGSLPDITGMHLRSILLQVFEAAAQAVEAGDKVVLDEVCLEPVSYELVEG